MAVVTVKVHHPHDGCAEGTKNHASGNPGVPGPLAARIKLPTDSPAKKVKAPNVMPPVKDNPGKSAVSKKISTLVHEGTPQKQAVATALSMKRAGRLTKEGGYIRAER